MRLLPPSPRDQQAGFNRTELMVVLASLALLLVITAPRLVRAGAADVAAACMNNHRALALAWSLFANDNGGKLVDNLTLSDTMATVNQKTYLNWANNVMDWTAAPMNTNLALVRSSKLFPYLQDNPLAFNCPADTFLTAAQRGAGWQRRTRSYSMNGFAGRPTLTADGTTAQGLNIYFPRYRQFLQLSSIPRPSSIFVFVDEHPDSINDGLFLNDPGNATMWSDLPASYHDGAGGFSFADGHAELRVWSNPQTRVPVHFFYTSVTIPRNASADYLWLMARTTVDPTTLGLTKSSSNQVQIVWSALPATYVLQVSDSMAPGSWTNTGAAPVKSLGQNAALVEIKGEQQFFRLMRQ